MTENNEFERHNLAIDRDMEVDCDIGQEIAVYIETWFDVDQKFGTNIADEDGTWLNMYGKYNPFVDTLRIECEISRDNGSEYFDYEPTASESRLIKDMIAEKIREEYRQTPQEFCDALNNTGESVYVYNNISSLTAEKLMEKHNGLSAYCAENGYQKEGGVSISAPIYRCGAEFQSMIEYCKGRGISKILVESLKDIGRTPDEVNRTVGILCAHGFNVEITDCGQVFSAENKENEEQSMTMGGLT